MLSKVGKLERKDTFQFILLVVSTAIANIRVNGYVWSGEFTHYQLKLLHWTCNSKYQSHGVQVWRPHQKQFIELIVHMTMTNIIYEHSNSYCQLHPVHCIARMIIDEYNNTTDYISC